MISKKSNDGEEIQDLKIHHMEEQIKEIWVKLDTLIKAFNDFEKGRPLCQLQVMDKLTKLQESLDSYKLNVEEKFSISKDHLNEVINPLVETTLTLKVKTAIIGAIYGAIALAIISTAIGLIGHYLKSKIGI